MASVTSGGFVRRTRTQIIEDITEKFQERFGENITTASDSVFGKFISILSEEVLRQEQLMEEVYANRSISGAEGVYLDDIASRYGLNRRGKIAGSGTAQVQYNNTIISGTTIATTAEITASNGIKYNPLASTELVSKWSGAVIELADLVAGNYNFSIVNTTTGVTENTTINLPDTTLASVITWMEALETFINDNTTDNATLIDVDAAGIINIGYNTSGEFIGLTEATAFSMAPLAGLHWAAVEVVAATPGYYPLPVGGVTNLSPSFTGFEDITNTFTFNAGSEVETDAELRIRIAQQSAGGVKGSRDYIVNQLLALDNVTTVRIYDNPETTTLTLTDPDGGPDFTVADPFTFNVVVLGGVASEIAQSIYESKPINCLTFGSTTTSVITADGYTENVSFTPAEERPLSVRITYSQPAGQPALSAGEQSAVFDSINTLISTQPIGATIFNSQLVASVLRTLSTSRLSSATVELKDEADADIEYSSSDFTVNYKQAATVSEAETFYVKV